MATLLDCSTNKGTIQTDGNLIYLNFTRDPGTWIYCNYPESLPYAALGDKNAGNKFLNQVVVNGSAELFASHVNNTGYDIYFGVQLYNAGGSTVSVTRRYNGHRHSGTYPDWCNVEGGVWLDYASNPDGSTFSVAPGTAVWIFEKNVPSGAYFNSILQFETSGSLYCFPYIYRSRSNLDGTATCYPWVSGSRVYRGYANSYFIRTSLNLNVSQMPYKYYTSNCTCGNTNEMISITDPCTGNTFSCSNGANLGNWGIHYYFTVTVNNNTSVTRRMSVSSR